MLAIFSTYFLQLLGKGACEPYLAFSTEIFVERFMSVLKVDNEEIKALYKRHVAILVSVSVN